ncbi:hypothetical protein [Niallia sp. 01092]|uniref:hypothetical protein n=1 Tax=unclassified Niallia TaxID=2837522 RepID=UPI003FCF7BAE
MEYDYYINPENWIGGFYELSIEYHPFGDDKRINEALNALCKSDFFNGMWGEKKDYEKHSISLPINIEDESVDQFYGFLYLSEENELPCMICVIRVSGESDWLDISIPQASFGKKYPYQYPLTKELNPWLNEVNEMYIKLAEIIFQNSPFDFTMIGEEISGYTNQKDITVEDVKNITCILPTQLQNKLGLHGKGKELSNQLRMFG